MSDHDSSTTTSTLAGVGLFLLTTALSQWIQNNTKKNCQHDTSCDTEMMEEVTFDEHDLRQLYQRRRLADRLSYEHLPHALSLEMMHQQREKHKVSEEHAAETTATFPRASSAMRTSSTLSESNSIEREPAVKEWNTLQQQQHMAKKAKEDGFLPLTKKLSEMEVHPNAHYDFHPKNRNWRHFEHYNETDRQRRLARQAAGMPVSERSITGSLAFPSMMTTKNARNPTLLTPQNDTNRISDEQQSGFQSRPSVSSELTARTTESENDSSDEDDNDAQSISSSSDSSEEQFVWTKHRHCSERVNLNKVAEQQQSNSQEDTAIERDPMDSSTKSAPLPASVSFPSRPVQMVRRLLSLDTATEGRANTTKQQPLVNPISLEMYNRRLRAEYNARIMPKKLVLVRHGQSMGNINEVLYSTTPDNSMPLTDLGWEQARSAGKVLREKILASGESVHFIVSPYVRTVETFHGLVSAWCDPSSEEFASISNHDEKVKAWYHRLMEMGLTWNEDSRLREQDFGNYQNPEVIRRAKEERWRFGAFYYRFPHGESASDVFDRVSTFLDSLWRSFEMNKSSNYVLVTHGIVLRVFLARYFRYTIDQFNTLANPKNCEMVVLGPSGNGKLDLEGRCALDIEEDPETKEPQVTGYKFHKRLRILPKCAIRKVKIRIAPDDKV
jgi:broad specificity phosphatase PhoE